MIILGINRLLRSASKRAHERRRSSPAENRALLYVCLFARFLFIYRHVFRIWFDLGPTVRCQNT